MTVTPVPKHFRYPDSDETARQTIETFKDCIPVIERVAG